MSKKIRVHPEGNRGEDRGRKARRDDDMTELKELEGSVKRTELFHHTPMVSQIGVFLEKRSQKEDKPFVK